MPAWKPVIVAFFALSALGLTIDSSDAKDKPSKPSKGAPGPVAGVGLPFLVIAGAYWLIRRRKNAKTEKQSPVGSAAPGTEKLGKFPIEIFGEAEKQC